MQQCALQFTLSAVTISIRADGRVAESNLLEFTLLCLVAFLTQQFEFMFAVWSRFFTLLPFC